MPRSHEAGDARPSAGERSATRRADGGDRSGPAGRRTDDQRTDGGASVRVTGSGETTRVTGSGETTRVTGSGETTRGAGPSDDDPHGADPTAVDREFGWRGYVLLGALFFAFVAAPLVVFYRPPALPWRVTLILFPLLPAIALGAVAVWATTRP